MVSITVDRSCREKLMTDLEETRKKLPFCFDNVAVILSGGMDSSIVTMMLARQYGPEKVFALTFNYGQKQAEECNKAKELCRELGIAHKQLEIGYFGTLVQPISANISGSDVEMPTIKDVLGDPQPPTYVPFRNMMLLSNACAFAEVVKAEYIFCGLQVHDEYGYWDTSQAFVDALNNVATLNRTFKTKIVAPFSQLSKTEELKICKELGNFDLLKHTLTCYDPDVEGKSCGTCPSCSERIKAFMNIGEPDPIQYQKEINWNV